MAIPATAAEGRRHQETSLVSAWLLQETGIQILREVVARCDEAAIPVLPVKGVVTSHWLYADVAERPITDVDIRVRTRDLRRFRRMAARAGWRCVRVALTYRNLIYDFGALSLDVEASVGPPGLCGLQVDAMIERSETLELAPGFRVSVPDIHDHAVLLVINAFKDKIAPAASWSIGDLERIVSQPSFRRDVFVERVQQARIDTIAWLVATWMETVRESCAWGAIRFALGSGGQIRRLYAMLFQRELARAEQAPMSLRLLARVGADSLPMQIAALVHLVAWMAEVRLRAGRT